VRYWLVMPAAGTGRRFGAAIPKQYAPLCGRTVIEWSLTPFVSDSRCVGIRVAVAPDDAHWAALQLEDPAGRLSSVIGGERRCDSVRLALASLPAESEDWVLVHDAARPCLTANELERLLVAAATNPQGALLAQPLADTLKRDDGVHGVQQTLDRAGLWRAQTPQMFRHGVLSEALALCASRGIEPTDESQAVELLGLRPLLVEGRAGNIKVTAIADLELAAAVLTVREED
jgi:2-C-methyl-D-erythritol 4-phosphate cytidylyltransferase